MEKKELLTEENYEKSKKKVTIIAIVVLLVGLALGLFLIGLGVSKQNAAKRENETNYKLAQEAAQSKAAEAEKRLEEIKKEIDDYNTQINALHEQKDALNMSDPNWFAQTSKYQREISDLDKKVAQLNTEKFKLENSNYTAEYDEISLSRFVPFYFFGGFIIVVFGGIALSIYFFAKGRDIAAFTMQQTMPLVQESIDKMTPTIANSTGTIAGSVAKSVTKGIKDGLKDEEEKDKEKNKDKK